MKMVFGTLLAVASLAAMGNVVPLSQGSDLEIAKEVRDRDGVGNFLEKLNAGKPVTVAYLGGSITEMNGWRNMTTVWLRKANPKANIAEVQAAIGGTGSCLGVFRVGHDALDKNPDLLFVEFATNDSGAKPEEIWRSMEGIVRRTWKQNEETDIIFVYTITATMTNKNATDAVLGNGMPEFTIDDFRQEEI